jgi:hypothetical protein
MHANRAVDAIVENDEQHAGAILHRSCQLLPVHQKITVAGKVEHDARLALMLRDDGGRNRGRRAVTHRAGSRC